MNIINNFKMFSIVVSDMKKSKEFYADTLGLAVSKDYREDDNNWWVTVDFPNGETSLTMSRAANYGMSEAAKPGIISIYFGTSDIEAARQALSDKGITVSGIQDDLFGPGSGAKFITLSDPDGNNVQVYQV